MDQSEIVVSFTLSVDEARHETAYLQEKAGVTKTQVSFARSVPVLWLLFGILDVATNHLRGTGWFSIFGGCLYTWLAFQKRSLIIDVPAGVETSIRFSRAGIVFERPMPQTLPWSAVAGVDRLQEALVVRFLVSAIKPPLEQRIVIPKRALGDGGDALWDLFAQMLVGPLRRVSAQMSVDEAGTVSRTDAESIGNRRARRASVKRSLPELSATATSAR